MMMIDLDKVGFHLQNVSQLGLLKLNYNEEGKLSMITDYMHINDNN